MDTEDLSYKSLENTLSALYRASNDLDGHFKEQLRPVITYYSRLYVQLTGQEYARGYVDHERIPNKPPILPKKSA